MAKLSAKNDWGLEGSFSHSKSKAGPSEKVHVSLTEYAYDVLEEDRLRFATIDHPVSRDELYNTILLHSYLARKEPAFLSREFFQLIQEWKKISGKKAPDTTQINHAFVQACKELYVKKYAEAKVQRTVNIYANVLDLVLELEDRAELQVFSTQIRYFTQVLESFARLSYGEREEIFFWDRIQLLKKASGNTPLKIEHINGQKGTFIPYEVKQDQLGLYWYAGGMMIESNDFNRSTPYSCSWRVSRLISIREDPRYEEGLGDKEKADLERMISEQKIQYLAAEQTLEIRFIVTDRGIELLNTILLNRPNGIRKLSETRNEYICTATAMQAKIYFQRLGKHVEILSPSGLLDHEE